MLLTTALKHRRLSTMAATMAESLPTPSLPSLTPTVSTLSNGVTVASIPGNAPATNIRINSLGSRFDKVGGESAALAGAGGGIAGREFVSFNSLQGFTTAASSSGGAGAAATNNDATAQMLDRLHETAFQGNSLANPLYSNSASSSDASTLWSGIQGSNVVVVGTGSHDQLVEESEKVLGGLKGGNKTSEVGSVVEKARFVGSDIRIRYDSHKTATIAIGFEGASWTDPKSFPLALMTTLLGSYTSSSGIGTNVAATMCQEVAEIAHSISAFNLSYSDTGLFGVVATAPDNMLDDLMWHVLPNMVRLAHGVSDEEFARAKLALKTQILMSMDGEVACVEEMARQLQTIGRVMPLSEALARVDALTMEDVKSAANEVINDQDHALAAIGGIHELPDYNWIRRKSYMLRY